MSTKLEKELRKPDAFLQKLNNAYQWALGHTTTILVALAVFAVVGIGTSIWGYFHEKNEAEWQEKYAGIEKRLLDVRQKFDEAEQKSQLQAAKKDPKAEAVTGLPTGDLAKDYGTIPADLEALINAAPKTRAAEMAALNLAELQVRHGQNDLAMATLEKVNQNDGTSDLVSALVVNSKANLRADKGDCAGALTLWEKIVRNSNANFLHDESRLRMGLCYETMNDLAKAEQVYTELATKDIQGGRDLDSTAAKDAERYLRLLKVKKATRGS